MFIFWENKPTERKSIHRVILYIDCRVKNNYKKSILIKNAGNLVLFTQPLSQVGHKR